MTITDYLALLHVLWVLAQVTLASLPAEPACRPGRCGPRRQRWRD